MDSFERAAQRQTIDNQRLGFRVHLAVYIAVQVLLVVTWYLTTFSGGDGFPWFLFPLVGWGIGLAAHYAVYSVTSRQRRDAVEGTGE